MTLVRITRRLAHSAIAALTVVTVVACSSSSDDGPGSAAPTTAATVEATTTAPADLAAVRDVDQDQLQAFADSLLPDTQAERDIVAWAVGDEEPLVVTTGVADARTGR